MRTCFSLPKGLAAGLRSSSSSSTSCAKRVVAFLIMERRVALVGERGVVVEEAVVGVTALVMAFARRAIGLFPSVDPPTPDSTARATSEVVGAESTLMSSSVVSLSSRVASSCCCRCWIAAAWLFVP